VPEQPDTPPVVYQYLLGKVSTSDQADIKVKKAMYQYLLGKVSTKW